MTSVRTMLYLELINRCNGLRFRSDMLAKFPRNATTLGRIQYLRTFSYLADSFRSSPQSFYRHHLSAISSAIACADALVVRAQAESYAFMLTLDFTATGTGARKDGRTGAHRSGRTDRSGTGPDNPLEGQHTAVSEQESRLDSTVLTARRQRT
eukprot:7381912-Prymnesium_polylepis.1